MASDDLLASIFESALKQDLETNPWYLGYAGLQGAGPVDYSGDKWWEAALKGLAIGGIGGYMKGQALADMETQEAEYASNFEKALAGDVSAAGMLPGKARILLAKQRSDQKVEEEAAKALYKWQLEQQVIADARKNRLDPDLAAAFGLSPGAEVPADQAYNAAILGQKKREWEMEYGGGSALESAVAGTPYAAPVMSADDRALDTAAGQAAFRDALIENSREAGAGPLAPSAYDAMLEEALGQVGSSLGPTRLTEIQAATITPRQQEATGMLQSLGITDPAALKAGAAVLDRRPRSEWDTLAPKIAQSQDEEAIMPAGPVADAIAASLGVPTVAGLPVKTVKLLQETKKSADWKEVQNSWIGQGDTKTKLRAVGETAKAMRDYNPEITLPNGTKLYSRDPVPDPKQKAEVTERITQAQTILTTLDEMQARIKDGSFDSVMGSDPAFAAKVNAFTTGPTRKWFQLGARIDNKFEGEILKIFTTPTPLQSPVEYLKYKLLGIDSEKMVDSMRGMIERGLEEETKAGGRYLTLQQAKDVPNYFEQSRMLMQRIQATGTQAFPGGVGPQPDAYMPWLPSGAGAAAPTEKTKTLSVTTGGKKVSVDVPLSIYQKGKAAVATYLKSEGY